MRIYVDISELGIGIVTSIFGLVLNTLWKTALQMVFIIHIIYALYYRWKIER